MFARQTLVQGEAARRDDFHPIADGKGQILADSRWRLLDDMPYSPEPVRTNHIASLMRIFVGANRRKVVSTVGPPFPVIHEFAIPVFVDVPIERNVVYQRPAEDECRTLNSGDLYGLTRLQNEIKEHILFLWGKQLSE